MPIMPDDVTAMVISHNEEPNIGRTLAALQWLKKIVVIDSGSTDSTIEIARQYGATVVHRPFDTFADQCNFGLSKVDTPYVLTLDADHVVATDFESALAACDPDQFSAWNARFRYCIFGRPLRSSLLPPRIALFRVTQGHFANDGHAHRVETEGAVGMLSATIDHDDRKPLHRWLAAQARYMEPEVNKLMVTPRKELSLPDRLRTHYLGPVLIVIYCLLVRRLILDGAHGLFYTGQRLYAELLFALRLYEARRTECSGRA